MSPNLLKQSEDSTFSTWAAAIGVTDDLTVIVDLTVSLPTGGWITMPCVAVRSACYMV